MSNAQTAKAPAPHVAPKPAAAPAPKAERSGLTPEQAAGASFRTVPPTPGEPAPADSAAAPAVSPARFKLVEGVLMPPSRRQSVASYPWDSLVVGGPALFVPGKNQKGFGGQVAQAGKAQRKKEGLESYKLSSRNMTHEGVAGVMVWRVA